MLDQIHKQVRIPDLASLAGELSSKSFMDEAIVLTFASLLVEIFGHLMITVIAAIGYLFYIKNSKLAFLCINIAGWSDAGNLIFSNLWGRDIWVKHIAPTRTTQGVYGAIFLPTLILMIYYVLGWRSDGYLALKLPLIDYLFLGFVCSSLSVQGNLLESFLKRVGNLKDYYQQLPD